VRVQAATSVTNNGMRRVLERSGYGFEGVLRKFAPGDVTGREDYVLYAALAP
jgi:RimJ/RimL family protein N-acetyltransferase